MSEDNREDLPGPFRGFVGVAGKAPPADEAEGTASEKAESDATGGLEHAVAKTREIAWHYTTGARFAEIDHRGEIRPSTGAIGRGGRPVVWFSLNEIFEPTARTMLEASDGSVRTLSMTETGRHGRGLFRIGVRVELLKDLDQWIADSRVPEDTADILKAIGEAHGADPRDWMVSFDTVERSDWLAVEVRYKGEWRSIVDD